MLSTLTALGLTLLPALAATAPTAPAQSWREEQNRMDRGRPTLIAWERSLDDALSLSRRTGRPLLVCVNLDGENASEAFAHSKYKRQAFADLVARYVPIIVSVNRHNPTDYDQQGRRIVCPRFGTVTCGEHIRPEQRVYELYLSGQRYAPRHVGVATDGTVLFDRFLDQDIGKVDRALREHAEESSGAWRDLALSRAAKDRLRLERAYYEGSAGIRRELLRAAAASDAEPYDLLRLGLADEDPKLRAAAVSALASIATANGLELVLDVLRDERLAEHHGLLTASLDRLARTDERAKRAAHRRRALATESKVVRIGSWIDALAAAVPQAEGPLTADALGARLDELLEREQASGSPPELVLEIALTHLAMAKAVLANGGNPSYFLVDADDAARRAQETGADPREVAVVASQAAWLLGEQDRAGKLAEEALPALLEDPAARATAEVLGILARVRVRSIYAAENAAVEWPAADLADAIAASDVLARHPFGDASQAIAAADLLSTLNLSVREGRGLRGALERFPASAELHARFRSYVERTSGITGFTKAYDGVRAKAVDLAVIDWFSGYSELIVAESHVRNREDAGADSAYARAIEQLERSVDGHPEFVDSVDHFVALALAGRAQAALSREDLDGATDLIAAAIERRPGTAESQDGLERTPLDVLRRVRRALSRAKRADLEQQLAERLLASSPDVWGKLEPRDS